MSNKPLELFQRDDEAKFIASHWFSLNSNKREQIEKWKELRNYIFVTDTRTTTNKKLPWKNSTTLPKLCQIRDNLHSNYISALFPNDEWLRWEAYTQDSAAVKKAKAIEAYMSNKTREGKFRSEISKATYDYIDYGNCFLTVDFEASFREDEKGNRIIDFIGPVARRISPLDIVFNPLANNFLDSYKIIRSVRTVGELKLMAEQEPDNKYLAAALEKRRLMKTGSYGIDNSDKAEAYQVDGFGNFYDYLQSNSVELLEFWGDLHNAVTGELEKGVVITIIDRAFVISKRKIPSWLGHTPIYHAGWRSRPDNLWAMGPLENLVGMQYRIDHIENLKADLS